MSRATATRAGEVFRLLLGGLPRALGGDVAKQSANPSGNCEEILRVDEYLCAAAIRAAGGQLLRVEPGVGGGRCSMIFDDAHGKASALLRLHKAGVLKVCSRDYADAVDAVKRELFAARGR
jgi:hypothetical protein